MSLQLWFSTSTEILRLGGTNVGSAGTNSSPRSTPRTSTLKFEVFLWKYAIADHVPGTRLNEVLRQQPGRELGCSLPHSWIDSRIERGELGSESHEADSAVDLCQCSRPL
jgi:hypothetical protein